MTRNRDVVDRGVNRSRQVTNVKWAEIQIPKSVGVHD
jgi:hypothetical protein